MDTTMFQEGTTEEEEEEEEDTRLANSTVCQKLIQFYKKYFQKNFQ
jgi:hypothetical protein